MRDIQPGDIVQVVDGTPAARRSTLTVVEFDGLWADVEARSAGGGRGVWRFDHHRILRLWPPAGLDVHAADALREARDVAAADARLVAEMRSASAAVAEAVRHIEERFGDEEGPGRSAAVACRDAAGVAAYWAAEAVSALSEAPTTAGGLDV